MEHFFCVHYLKSFARFARACTTLCNSARYRIPHNNPSSQGVTENEFSICLKCRQHMELVMIVSKSFLTPEIINPRMRGDISFIRGDWTAHVCPKGNFGEFARLRIMRFGPWWELRDFSRFSFTTAAHALFKSIRRQTW